MYFLDCEDNTQRAWIRDEIEKLNCLYDSHKEPDTESDKYRFLVLSRFNDDARGIQDWLKKQNFNGCTCSTIHSAKGVEADYVFILDCQKIPYVKNTNRFNLKDKIVSLLRNEGMGKNRYKEKEMEERRLFYVAMTRARLAVYFLSWNGRDDSSQKGPSYLTEIKQILKKQGIEPTTIKVSKNTKQKHPLYQQNRSSKAAPNRKG